MSSAPRLGKYFFIRGKDNPAFVLEIEDGLDQPHVNVLVGEVSGNTDRAHQLWYIDITTFTIRSKLNQFCLDSNNDVFRVSPFVTGNVNQNWIVEGDHVQSKHDSSRILGVAEPLLTVGKPLRAVTLCQDERREHLWTIDYQPPLYFYIKLYNNTAQVLDIRGADKKSGAKVIVFANKGDLADNQLWYEDETCVLRSKLNGFAIDSSDKALTMRPFDKTNKFQQWIINESWIQNRLNPRQVLLFKPGALLSSATAVPTEKDPSDSNILALWKFEFIPDQSESLNHSGCGKHFVIRSRLSGLVLEVQGRAVEPGGRVTIEPGCPVATTNLTKDMSMIARQQFYADEITGTLRNTLRNYCIDVVDDRVVLSPYDPYRKSQQWNICGKKIQNRHNLTQVLQLCDRDKGGGDVDMTKIGVNVTTGDYNGAESQFWEIMHTPARCFYIISQMNEKVLDVEKDEASAGATVIMYDRKAVISLNQLWYEDENGVIRSKLNGYVLDSSSK